MSAVLYRNADVVTLEPGAPRVAAVATVDGRILAVGDEAACRERLRGRDATIVDAAGACIVPGFIDTHLHPIGLLYYDLNADLRGVRSIDDLQAALRTAAARLGPDEWVVGLSLEDEHIGGRLPTRAELDAACPDRPVVVMEHDGHSAAGNGLALAAAGIDATMADPPGGRIERNPDGTPSGPCRETAAQRLVGAVPSPSLERLRETALGSFRRLAACGITSAGVVLQTDAEGPGGNAGRLEWLAMQLLLEVTPFATYAILVGESVDAAVGARDTALHDPPAGRRVGGFKIFADGTFSSCTACMREPFADRPAERGFLRLDEDEIFARMRAAHAAGLQICVHAIGDGAVERCVSLYARLLAEQPRPDHSHRIEHASIVRPELARRMAGLGVCVSTQPLFIDSEKTWLHRRLGAERARHAYPLRTLLDAGVRVGGASDAPVESTSVLHAMQCCVTREGFEVDQAISPEEALRLFTSDAAFVQFEEHEKGTLAPGKRADLVLLGRNPLTVSPDRIADVRVLRTVVAGRIAWDADGTEDP